MDSKFKVGDVLKFEDGTRAIVADIFPQATNSNEYLIYLWGWYKGTIDWDSWSESALVDKVKLIDHIDISSVVGEEPEEEKKKKEKDWSKALSNFASYDDLVIRGKVDYDQINRVKIGENTIEFETVDKNIRELQKENEGLKKEIDILKSKVNLLLDRTARLDKITRLMSR